jgi:hypothetical protein
VKNRGFLGQTLAYGRVKEERVTNSQRHAQHNSTQYHAPFRHTRQFMGPIGHLLHDAERNDAFREIYRLTRTAIERYTVAEEWRRKRLRPEE